MTYPQKFLDLMNLMFGHEGKTFTNDPVDLGGPTKMGITIDALRDYYRTRPELGVRPQDITMDDIKNLTQDQAMKIYYEDYYLRSGADKRDDIRDSYLLFDSAVQQSPYSAQKWYQNHGNNFYDVIKARKKFYENRIKERPDQIKFQEGWNNRLRDIEINANKLIEQPEYKPEYQNNITPFDEGYEGPLKLTPEELKKSPEELKRARNKYLYILNQKGIPTGFATSIDEKLAKSFTPSDISKMSNAEFRLFESKINSDLANGLIRQNDISDYIRHLAPEALIYTKELINSLSNDDINKNLAAMTVQQKNIGIPYESELKKAIVNSTGDVYVSSYTRHDGTKVNAYWRSRPSF